MTSGYARSTRLDDLLACARELAVKTIIFEVEPLIAPIAAGSGAAASGIFLIRYSLMT